MKKIIQLKLKYLARIIIKKYQPEVIGITGSVGKTSAKKAIWTVLSNNFKVRKSIKNYNNELGVPLTIINAKSGGKSILKWFKVFIKALKLILITDKNYPKILILEMGADHPNDIDYLINIAQPKIAIITTIGPSHLKFFNSLDNIRKEKSKLVKNIKQGGWAVINYDNEQTRKIINYSKVKVQTFGLQEKAMIKAQEIIFNQNQENNELKGINFKLCYNGSFVPVLLPNSLGKQAVYSALIGATIGIIYNLNLLEISNSLRNFITPQGRMRIIKGIKNTTIIDDTYNSSPQSCLLALEAIQKVNLNKGRKIAVLGEMLELGNITEKSHNQIGKDVFKSGFDQLILVGERTLDTKIGAEKAGFNKDNIFYFPNSKQAGMFVQERITENDLILVKGSQGVRMEKIVKEIMKDPLEAKNLLVRQDEQWI